MSDRNSPEGRERPEAPAEGPDDASVEDDRSDEGIIDEAAPDEDMALQDVEPPPPVDESLQGVPDTSIALGEIDPDEPGANATGVGV
jgi:hypothetical protein